jgi:hypothetical protein
MQKHLPGCHTCWPGQLDRKGRHLDSHRSGLWSNPMSAQLGDSWDTVLAQDGAAGALIDNALCNRA